MAASVSFIPFKDTGDYISSFNSTDGEVCIMRYHSNAVTHEGNLTLHWPSGSVKSVKVSRYDDPKRCSFETFMFAEDQTCAVSFKYFRTSMVFINVTPSVRLRRAYAIPAEGPSTQAMPLTHCKSKPHTQTQLEQLTKDLKDLFATGRLSDVVLTDGLEEIHAHKLILSARSSVFDKMFQHPMKENRENRITVEDIPIEVMRELLHFMYTGSVTINDWGTTRDLYVAADKYDVKDLVNICSSLLKRVDLSNVLDALVLADLYEDYALREAALTFISNHYSELKARHNWNNFMKQSKNLAIEVLSFVIEKKV